VYLWNDIWTRFPVILFWIEVFAEEQSSLKSFHAARQRLGKLINHSVALFLSSFFHINLMMKIKGIGSVAERTSNDPTKRAQPG